LRHFGKASATLTKKSAAPEMQITFAIPGEQATIALIPALNQES
jgi:hypothetical protein